MLHFCHYLHAFLYSLHVERNEAVMALGQGLEQCLVQSLCADDRTNLEQSAQYNHVEYLRVLQLGSLVHSVDTVYIDILTCRRIDDAETIVYKYAARLNLRLKLVERRLVEHYSHIVMAENWR